MHINSDKVCTSIHNTGYRFKIYMTLAWFIVNHHNRSIFSLISSTHILSFLSLLVKAIADPTSIDFSGALVWLGTVTSAVVDSDGGVPGAVVAGVMVLISLPTYNATCTLI